jgi:hypothetical protein
MKTVWYTSQILIDQSDAVEIKDNDIVTFMVFFMNIN